MISIVTVYNNKELLNRILLPSIKNQTAKYEFIPIDNTDGRFKSAAAALNYGAKQANGDYIMFVHQDVELDSPTWLETTEDILKDISDLGIAGVAGMSDKGRNKYERGRGYISDSGEIWKHSNAVQKPEVLQTLDECLLIIPKLVFNKLQFDETTFDNWHCYGADYCLSITQLSLKSYVIPKFIYHRTLRQNVRQLTRYQYRLRRKHKSHYKAIYTTCGDISLIKLYWRLIKDILLPLYSKLLNLTSVTLIKNALANYNTILDLGCGRNSSIQYCEIPFSVGVELFEPYLQESRKKGIHSQYIKADIRKIEFMPESFDAVVAIEILEHLTKDEGYELISKMERWARKKIVITTPNRYLWQDDYDDNILQKHKSAWDVKELSRLGYKVYGMGGWKILRGYRAEIKYRPALLFRIISDLTQELTYRVPQLAFQLIAVKNVEHK